MKSGRVRSLELEVGARTVDDVLAAERGGACRVELYTSPLEGALTPSAGLIRCAVEAARTVKLFVMIRPRAGDFCYSNSEFAMMRKDVDTALELGAHGLMFGILDPQGYLDCRRMQLLVDQCGDTPLTLHRAFDFVPDPFEALEQAAALGFRFVMTMGQEQAETFSAEVRRQLVHKAAEQIQMQMQMQMQIALGADFHTTDLPGVVRATGARHFHLVNGFRTRPGPMSAPDQPETQADYLRQTLAWIEYLEEEAVREARDILDQMEEAAAW